MIKYEKLYSEVKKILSDSRFKHSESVVKRAIEYAKIYGVDIETVKLVAISHDIAKELTVDEIKKYVYDYNIEFDDIEKVSKSLIHTKIGAYICKFKYGFTDDMVSAVRYHTTGRENMSMLEKIIYLADATEENRKNCPIEYIDIIKNDIDIGILKILKLVIGNLLQSNKIIHTDSIRCYNYYLNKYLNKIAK